MSNIDLDKCAALVWCCNQREGDDVSLAFKISDTVERFSCHNDISNNIATSFTNILFKGGISCENIQQIVEYIPKFFEALAICVQLEYPCETKEEAIDIIKTRGVWYNHTKILSNTLSTLMMHHKYGAYA